MMGSWRFVCGLACCGWLTVWILSGCAGITPRSMAAAPQIASAPATTEGRTSSIVPVGAEREPGRNWALYPVGSPTLADLWVDPVHGDDGRSGSSRDQALRTINEAWQRIPQGAPLAGTGYRLQLMAGEYPEDAFPVYWEARYGTAEFPILIQAADAPGSARLHGFVNVFDTRYLYLINLTVTNQGDVFHCEQCDHLLIRGVRMDGGSGRLAHETLKVNQSQHVYIEESDIFNTYENAIDFVGVQVGHIVGNRLHDADDWCIYLKGGSAYFRVEGNEIYNCGTGGFTAGQGTGFEYMVSPWLHYEAYDIKFVNNLVHDTQGAGMGVNGGYNILLAYNTLFRVGANSHLIEVVFGSRSCDGEVAACAAHLAAGGWGTTAIGDEGEPIPNRNIYIYNNILYNPPGYRSQWQHFAIYGTQQPQLINPQSGDFHPLVGGMISQIPTYPIPDFAWADAPSPPMVPAGGGENQILTDRDGRPRGRPGIPGAYRDAALPALYLPVMVVWSIQQKK